MLRVEERFVIRELYSYLATLRKQGRQLLTALELACAGHPPLPCPAPE